MFLDDIDIKWQRERLYLTLTFSSITWDGIVERPPVLSCNTYIHISGTIRWPRIPREFRSSFFFNLLMSIQDFPSLERKRSAT